MAMPEREGEPDRRGLRAAEKKIGTLKARGGAFVAAVEATRMPMVVTDPNLAGNPIVYANEAFLNLCGYAAEEILGRSYGFIAGSDEQMENGNTGASAKHDARIRKLRLYCKDGTPIWVAAAVNPVIEKDRVVQYFASFLDITHQVQLEHELKEAKNALERRVADRTRQLQAANTELEREVARRTQVEATLRKTLGDREEDLRYRIFLAREIDHRTKNALQLAASLLQVQASRITDPVTSAALRDARSRLDRIADVHTLLYQSSRPDIVDFAPYLHRLAEELGETLQTTPGQVVIEVETKEVSLDPDVALHLGLIAGEAITNAMKHAFPNGRRGRIVITFGSAGGLMRLVVEDDGIGLQAASRPDALGLKLIDMFANRIRGTATIGPGRKGGTSVAVAFPIADRPTRGDGQEGFGNSGPHRADG